MVNLTPKAFFLKGKGKKKEFRIFRAASGVFLPERMTLPGPWRGDVDIYAPFSYILTIVRLGGMSIIDGVVRTSGIVDTKYSPEYYFSIKI
jgi:PhoPQ-activated pathogenicity-related protein